MAVREKDAGFLRNMAVREKDAGFLYESGYKQ